jgi:eukaryotic-like serine/threonine-protein kinase
MLKQAPRRELMTMAARPRMPDSTSAATHETLVDERPRADELAAGTMVGEYRVDGLLGEGAMGVVYAATQPLIEKRAAIKVIHRAINAHPDAAARFIDEARAVNRISHPNIVDIFSFGALPDGRPYLVMELLDGENLRDQLLDGRLDRDQRVDVLEQVCRALNATHAKGIIHRDLKPENVFLTLRDGEPSVVKLLDFGIAKLGGDESGHVARTRDGAVVGTPLYIAPEQARGKPVDWRCDVYSLGVVAFEMLVGRVPFFADSGTELMHLHVAEPPPRPSSLWPEIPTSLERLLLSMLHKDPAERPSAAEALATFSAARIALRSGDHRAEPTTAPMPQVPVEPGYLGAAQPLPTSTAPPAPPTRRRKHYVLLAGMIAGTALAIAARAVVSRWSGASSTIEPAAALIADVPKRAPAAPPVVVIPAVAPEPAPHEPAAPRTKPARPARPARAYPAKPIAPARPLPARFDDDAAIDPFAPFAVHP